MAIEREIKIVADTSQAERATDSLNDNLDKVDKNAEKANTSLKDVGDNGGAIAILDSLTGGLATRLRDAFEASKLFNGSLKATRGALIATGIGAFVVAIGLVAAYWDDIVEFITEANKKLQIQIDKGIELQETLSFQLEIYDLQKQTLAAQEKSTKEIDDLTKETLEKQLIQAENNLKLLKSQQQIELSKSIELSFWNKIQIAAGGTLGAVQLITDEEKKRLDELKKNTQEQEKFIEGLKLRLALIGQNRREELKARQELAGQAEEEPERGQVKELFKQSEGAVNLSEDPEVLFEQEKKDRIAQLDNELTEIQLANARRVLLERELTAQNTVAIERNTFDLLNNIAREGSKLGKAVAIAQVVRDTQQGVTATITNTIAGNAKAIKELGPIAGSAFAIGNTISAGIGIASSIAGAVKAINAINSEQNTLSGVSGGNIPNNGTTAPSFNLVQGTGSNQIAEGLQQEREPVRAFVVTGDVTTGQELDRNIQGDASLG